MRISTITPDHIGNNPIFNLSAIGKSTNPNHKANNTLDWLQSQENKNKFEHISVFVDKFSNVFVKDFAIFKSYLLHCVGGDINSIDVRGV